MASFRSARGVCWRSNELCDPLGNLFDAIRLRLVQEPAKAQQVIANAFRLEGQCTRMNAAIELGQHHMHGQIGGRQAALVVRPGFTPGRRDNCLHDRYAEAIENRCLTGLSAAGESGGGHDQGR